MTDAQAWTERVDKWAEIRQKAKDLLDGDKFLDDHINEIQKKQFPENPGGLLVKLVELGILQLKEMGKEAPKMRKLESASDRDVRRFEEGAAAAPKIEKMLKAVKAIAESEPNVDLGELEIVTSKGLVGFGKKKEKVVDVLANSDEAINNAYKAFQISARASRTLADRIMRSVDNLAEYQQGTEFALNREAMAELAQTAVMDFGNGADEILDAINQQVAAGRTGPGD